jgi:hypothetical protein
VLGKVVLVGAGEVVVARAVVVVAVVVVVVVVSAVDDVVEVSPTLRASTSADKPATT